jgi:hypothetical protein
LTIAPSGITNTDNFPHRSHAQRGRASRRPACIEDGRRDVGESNRIGPYQIVGRGANRMFDLHPDGNRVVLAHPLRRAPRPPTHLL